MQVFNIWWGRTAFGINFITLKSLFAFIYCYFQRRSARYLYNPKGVSKYFILQHSSLKTRKQTAPLVSIQLYLLGTAVETLAVVWWINREPPNGVITENQTSIFHPCTTITLSFSSHSIGSHLHSLQWVIIDCHLGVIEQFVLLGPWAGLIAVNNHSLSNISNIHGEKGKKIAHKQIAVSS